MERRWQHALRRHAGIVDVSNERTELARLGKWICWVLSTFLLSRNVCLFVVHDRFKLTNLAKAD